MREVETAGERTGGNNQNNQERRRDEAKTSKYNILRKAQGA